MIEKHIDAEKLRQKIEDLFEYRLFPDLFQSCGMANEVKNQFWEQLIELQTSIYHLDAHLEAHVQPVDEILTWHHSQIQKRLQDILSELPESHTYFEDLYMYERHELNLRKGISPLSYDMLMFYYYKSCDVKLLRRLIYERCDLSSEWGILEGWKAYDLITEVNDDVEDIWEDKDFINGNMFLISLLLQERELTESLFHSFMDKIADLSHDIAEKAPSRQSVYLHQMTLKRVEETRLLMLKQLEDERLQSLSEARITILTNTMKKSFV
jgi:hypothetical protein